MYGLFFAMWEKFLFERYGKFADITFREATVGVASSLSLHRNEIFYQACNMVSATVGIPVCSLLREYGRYLVAYAANSRQYARMHSSQELLLEMVITGDVAGFSYEKVAGDHVRLCAIQPYQSCSVVYGMIEGAGMVYRERIQIEELSCLVHGEGSCQFDVRFGGSLPKTGNKDILYREVANLIFTALPDKGRGMTACEISNFLTLKYKYAFRPSYIAWIMIQLQGAGLLIVSDKESGDMFYEREYLRSPATDLK